MHHQRRMSTCKPLQLWISCQHIFQHTTRIIPDYSGCYLRPLYNIQLQVWIKVDAHPSFAGTWHVESTSIGNAPVNRTLPRCSLANEQRILPSFHIWRMSWRIRSLSTSIEPVGNVEQFSQHGGHHRDLFPSVLTAACGLCLSGERLRCLIEVNHLSLGIVNCPSDSARSNPFLKQDGCASMVHSGISFPSPNSGHVTSRNCQTPLIGQSHLFPDGTDAALREYSGVLN